MVRRAVAVWLVLAVAGSGLAQTAQAGVGEFAFIQLSDVHVSPHLERGGPPGPPRGAQSIAWICQEVAGVQRVGDGLVTPTPAFALVTGDLTEYGVIDDTWNVFEEAWSRLPCPYYVLPGNHDNTWVAMYGVMRARHGGANYSFDRFGCHFVCLCSASPQEPLPSLDGGTRAWLRRDLESVAPGTPVFVALHHPPYGSEFAPGEYDALIDLLRDYNVVLVMYGHGHGVGHRDMDGLDGVMGGSTYGKNAGYALISVQEGRLRVAYHYYRPPKGTGEPVSGAGWRMVLDKAVSREVRERLFRVVKPEEGVVVSSGRLEVELAGRGGGEGLEVSFRIDGREVPGARAGDAGLGWRLPVGELVPGRHWLTVRAARGKERDLRTVTFAVTGEEGGCRWRRTFPTGFKAGPVVVGELVIAAGTDGVVRGLDRADGVERWRFATGGEVLGTPAWAGGLIVFGSGDGYVYALDAQGHLVWKYQAGRAVYGSPTVSEGVVYVGDNGGRLHALEAATGARRWVFSRADYAIECRPAVWGDRIVFGAWDGYLYALRRVDGTLAWKVWGPKSSEGKAARYYAPADCGPVVLGERLYVCDRGYYLAAYGADGTAGPRLAEGVAAVAGDGRGEAVVVRGTDDRVGLFDGDGRKRWEQAVPAGRFPIPPTVAGGRIYVCSNTGRLSVLALESGRVLWEYQVTPGYYVMAPVAVDEQGTCYLAGMDGTVTALRPDVGGR